MEKALDYFFRFIDDKLTEEEKEKLKEIKEKKR